MNKQQNNWNTSLKWKSIYFVSFTSVLRERWHFLFDDIPPSSSPVAGTWKYRLCIKIFIDMALCGLGSEYWRKSLSQVKLLFYIQNVRERIQNLIIVPLYDDWWTKVRRMKPFQRMFGPGTWWVWMFFKILIKSSLDFC